VGRMRSSRRTSLPRLQPNEGRWALDYGLVDRTGPYPWPDKDDPLYEELAGYLARHNEMSLDEVLVIERTNRQLANHAVTVDDLSEQAQKQFEIVYRREALDESADADVEVLTLSWCRRAGDPRRVICLISGAERKVLPLWWDPQHQVSGDNGREPNAAPCPGGCLHGDSKQH